MHTAFVQAKIYFIPYFLTIGKYVGTNKFASVPYLITLSGDTFAVMWQEFSMDSERGDLVLLLVNDKGNALASEKRFQGYELSDCRPILDSAGNLLWYTDDYKNGKYLRTFYTINVLSKPSAWAAHAIAEAKSKGLVTEALSMDYQGEHHSIGILRSGGKFY